ncbi:hypothetical protein M9Y10_011231 [Tritrichomonas musculus]|uniref:SAC3/GANP/THP3 conserved domain-containing protein n=1 Tax=Tritrichomonas musculus TaxID=1915356 RepID=A0ABR2IIW3_9EUKA
MEFYSTGKKNIGENIMVGTCLNMCPERDIELNKNELSPFEFDESNNFNEKYAIAKFHRSDSSRFDSIKSDDVRPLPVLQKTIQHILNFVIAKRLNTLPKTTEIDLYMYLRGRFRAICTDITIQHLEGKEVIEIYQTMILYFIWAGVKFPNICDRDSFDHIMNLQIMTNMFSSLNDQYDTFFRKTGLHYPFESDFRSFYLLKYVPNDAGQFLPQLLTIPKDLFETTAIRNVINLRQSIISNRIPDFIKIIDSASIQFAAMALQNVPTFYFMTFHAMKKALGRHKFNKNFFTSFLELPNEYFQMFEKNFSLIPDPNSQNNDVFTFDKNAQPSITAPPALPLPSSIRRRYESLPLLEFFIFKPTQNNIPTITESKVNNIPEIRSEVDIKPEIETNIQEQNEIENVNNISSQTSDVNQIIFKPPSPKPFLFKKIETPVKEEAKHEESTFSLVSSEAQEENQVSPSLQIASSPISIQGNEESGESISEEPAIYFPCIMKMKKKVLKPQLFNFVSMIPSSLPPFCYISIVINDSDDSPSAGFVRDCLNNRFNLTMKNDIIYLGNSKMVSSICKKSHVYMSIVRKRLQKYMNDVGAILHCEDTTECKSENIPIFTFSLANSKSSPELILNNLIRKCIETAVVEFQPMDLTEIVRSALSMVFKIILSSGWQKASCNSILKLFNNVILSLANVFESELFMRFLLPFIHNQFGPDNMKEFSSSIRKMKFSLIDKNDSVQPRSDSNWPLFIRDNMKINSITPFIAPVSAKFDSESFLRYVISPFEDSLPSEYVKPPKEVTSYDDILRALDYDLYD